MTLHRFLYKLCWRTRLLIPIFVLISLIATLLLLTPGNHLDKHHPHQLFPRFKHSWDKVDQNEDVNGGVPPVREEDLNVIRPTVNVLSTKYLDPNHQNALLFKANASQGVLNDPLVVSPLLSRIYFQRHRTNEKNTPKIRKKVKVKPHHNTHIFHDAKSQPEIFEAWTSTKASFCDGKMEAYQNEFTHMKNVIIDKSHCISNRKGGEFLEEVVNQEEEMEYFQFESGCFELSCPIRPDYYFNNKNHLNDYLLGLRTRSDTSIGISQKVSNFTILVTRYEYANIYHTMTDWYNAFLLMEYFNKTQAETNILIVDTHPRGVLDPVWPVLFNSVNRLSYLGSRTLYTDMVWGILGYNSGLLAHYQPHLPMLEEFRAFFLSSYFISPNKHQLDCNKLSVMFVWRRDYVAHPRNPAGQVSRKVRNERELMAATQKLYPEFNIRGVQLDLFDMQQQLRLIASTDILIGMHGAGLTHTLFLPKKAAIIELVPNYFSSSSDHFLSLATWHKLHYQRWVNEDPRNEIANFYTRIPPHVVGALIKKAVKDMCLANRPSDPGGMIHPYVVVNNNGEVISDTMGDDGMGGLFPGRRMEDPVDGQHVVNSQHIDQHVGDSNTGGLVNEPLLDKRDSPVNNEVLGDQPVVDQPDAKLKAINQPIANQPVAYRQVANQLVANQPIANQPVADLQVANRPVADLQVANQPVADLQVANQPVADLQVANQPVADLQVANQPVAYLQVVSHKQGVAIRHDNKESLLDPVGEHFPGQEVKKSPSRPAAIISSPERWLKHQSQPIVKSHPGNANKAQVAPEFVEPQHAAQGFKVARKSSTTFRRRPTRSSSLPTKPHENHPQPFAQQDQVHFQPNLHQAPEVDQLQAQPKYHRQSLPADPLGNEEFNQGRMLAPLKPAAVKVMHLKPPQRSQGGQV